MPYDAIYNGIRYCYCYSDGIAATWGDPFNDTKTNYDWIDEAVSVLFTPTEFAQFRGTDSAHRFLIELREQNQKDAHRYKRLWQHSVAYARKRLKRDEYWFGGVNLTEVYKTKYEFHRDNTVVLLEINFDK